MITNQQFLSQQQHQQTFFAHADTPIISASNQYANNNSNQSKTVKTCLSPFLPNSLPLSSSHSSSSSSSASSCSSFSAFSNFLTPNSSKPMQTNALNIQPNSFGMPPMTKTEIAEFNPTSGNYAMYAPVYYNTPISTPNVSQVPAFFQHSNSSTAPSYCCDAQQHIYCHQETTTPQTPSTSLSFYSYDNYKTQPLLQQQMNDSGVFLGNSVCSKFDAKEAPQMPSASTSATQSEADNSEFIAKKEKLYSSFTSKTNLYIRGLSEDTTDNDLYEMCKKYGEIKSTKAIIDKQTNKCKGYGFVDFKSMDDAKTALNEMKKEQKDVQLAKQREQDPTNLYFANLPPDIDEKWLNDMLKTKFTANINSTRIMKDRNGNSKGVGFARIDDNKLCDIIIQELNGKAYPDHSNKTKCLLVKLADSGGSFKINNKRNKSKDNYSSFATSNGNISLNEYNVHTMPNTYHHSQYNLNHHCQIAPESFSYNGYPIQFYDPSAQAPLYHHINPQPPSTPQTPTTTIYQSSHTNTFPAVQTSNTNIAPPLIQSSQPHPQPIPQINNSYSTSTTSTNNNIGTARPISSHNQHHHMHAPQPPLNQAQYLHAAPPASITHQIVPTHHHHHHQSNPYTVSATNGLPPTNYSYYTSPQPHHNHMHHHPSHHQIQPHYVIIQHPNGMNQAASYYSGHYQHQHHHHQHPIVNNINSTPFSIKSNESNSASITNTTTSTQADSNNNINNGSTLSGSPSINNSTPTPSSITAPPASLSANPSNLSQQFSNMSLTNGIHSQFMNNNGSSAAATPMGTNQKPVINYHSNTVHIVSQQQQQQQQQIAQTVPNVSEVKK